MDAVAVIASSTVFDLNNLSVKYSHYSLGFSENRTLKICQN